MKEDEIAKVGKEYFKKFGSFVPIIYAQTKVQYVGIYKAAKKALETGEELTAKQAIEACGFKYDEKNLY